MKLLHCCNNHCSKGVFSDCRKPSQPSLLKMPCIARIGGVTHSRISEVESSIEWRIPDFLSLDVEREDYYVSNKFHCCGGIWQLLIFPKGYWQPIPSDHVSLVLCRVDITPSPIKLSITIGIQGEEEVQNKCWEGEEFFREATGRFWLKFYSRKQLKEEKSRLMCNNALTIVVDMRRVYPTAKGDTSTQTEEYEVDKVGFEGSPSSEKQGGGEKALKDFGKLLASSEKSDVTLQVGDIEYKVHSFILFARSPALSMSLQCESKEKASRKIVVEDCEPDAFPDFLHYLYTGSVQPLSEKIVFALYQIADKYLAEDLKNHCLEHIQDTLSVQTFCNSMKLALTYGESGLLQKAIDFATKNIRSLVCSVEWQDFICKHPIEANEIFMKSLGPPCNCQ